MQDRPLSFAILFLSLLLLSNCDMGKPLPTDLQQEPIATDPQILKLFFKYGFRNQVDTFKGTLTKDLVINGTVTAPFLFTASQQDSILGVLSEAEFFNLPDTLYPVPNMLLLPDHGPQILRVQYQSSLKSLMWSYVLDQSDPRNDAVLRLWRKLQQIVESTDAFKRLPPAVGAYI